MDVSEEERSVQSHIVQVNEIGPILVKYTGLQFIVQRYLRDHIFWH